MYVKTNFNNSASTRLTSEWILRDIRPVLLSNMKVLLTISVLIVITHIHESYEFP